MPSDRFLIQRYSGANWDAVKGLAPFVCTGPRFRAYTTTQALTEYEWKFRQVFVDDISSVGENVDFHREVVAELLLREGIVQALWSVSSEECLPEGDRWSLSIRQVAAEIPKDDPLAVAVVDFLSGLADPGHFRSYVAEDQLELVPCPVP